MGKDRQARAGQAGMFVLKQTTYPTHIDLFQGISGVYQSNG